MKTAHLFPIMQQDAIGGKMDGYHIEAPSDAVMLGTAVMGNHPHVLAFCDSDKPLIKHPIFMLAMDNDLGFVNASRIGKVLGLVNIATKEGVNMVFAVTEKKMLSLAGLN